jgi:hypothetical protein
MAEDWPLRMRCPNCDVHLEAAEARVAHYEELLTQTGVDRLQGRVAELEAALQETLWQIEHDPPLLPQAKEIARVALKGKEAK